MPMSRRDRVLAGQERAQQREQGVRSVQRDDVAAVFDHVSGEVVGDRAELVFQRGADGPNCRTTTTGTGSPASRSSATRHTPPSPEETA